jgi:hypothetical protein
MVLEIFIVAEHNFGLRGGFHLLKALKVIFGIFFSDRHGLGP